MGPRAALPGECGCELAWCVDGRIGETCREKIEVYAHDRIGLLLPGERDQVVVVWVAGHRRDVRRVACHRGVGLDAHDD
jgi:hypothetical protein